jgi:hypothetical protein
VRPEPQVAADSQVWRRNAEKWARPQPLRPLRVRQLFPSMRSRRWQLCADAPKAAHEPQRSPESKAATLVPLEEFLLRVSREQRMLERPELHQEPFSRPERLQEARVAVLEYGPVARPAIWRERSSQ